MASTATVRMNESQEFFSETRKYTVWTSYYAGDLFRADRIIVDDSNISFYRGQNTLVKQYRLIDFVKNNPELFEGIQQK